MSNKIPPESEDEGLRDTIQSRYKPSMPAAFAGKESNFERIERMAVLERIDKLRATLPLYRLDVDIDEVINEGHK